MNAILIAYDLHKLGQRYADLKKLIEGQYTTYWHCLESTYIVATPRDPVQVRDSIRSALDSNDELVVFLLDKSTWATQGLSEECLVWLKNNL